MPETESLIHNYTIFLNILSKDLKKIFDYQKEHICCKAGCSLCCERGNYPFSQLEFKYLMYGFEKLDENLKKKIYDKISDLKLQNTKSYKCPFLINNTCSVYEYRGIICRTFGVLSIDFEGATIVPFCAGQKLNYSRYWDDNIKNLSNDLLKNLPSNNPPKAFNLNLNTIMNLSIVKELELNFGEVRTLINWFE